MGHVLFLYPTVARDLIIPVPTCMWCSRSQCGGRIYRYCQFVTWASDGDTCGRALKRL